jgi:hypothetical protein
VVDVLAVRAEEAEGAEQDQHADDRSDEAA